MKDEIRAGFSEIEKNTLNIGGKQSEKQPPEASDQTCLNLTDMIYYDIARIRFAGAGQLCISQCFPSEAGSGSGQGSGPDEPERRTE